MLKVNCSQKMSSRHHISNKQRKTDFIHFKDIFNFPMFVTFINVGAWLCNFINKVFFGFGTTRILKRD